MYLSFGMLTKPLFVYTQISTTNVCQLQKGLKCQINVLTVVVVAAVCERRWQ